MNWNDEWNFEKKYYLTIKNEQYSLKLKYCKKKFILNIVCIKNGVNYIANLYTCEKISNQIISGFEFKDNFKFELNDKFNYIVIIISSIYTDLIEIICRKK